MADCGLADPPPLPTPLGANGFASKVDEVLISESLRKASIAARKCFRAARHRIPTRISLRKARMTCVAHGSATGMRLRRKATSPMPVVS